MQRVINTLCLAAVIATGVTDADLFPAVDFGHSSIPASACSASTERINPVINAPPALSGVSAGDFVVDYNADQVQVLGKNAFALKMKLNSATALNDDPVGTRIATKSAYESGKISARIASGAAAPGLVSSFYLSDSEPMPGDERKQYEVDFELMGARGNRYVQTNAFKAGAGGQEDYHVVADHPSASHEYAFEWDVKAGYVKLSIDGKQVRQIDASGWPALRYIGLTARAPQ